MRACVEERAAQRPRRQCGSATWLCAAEEAHGMLWKGVGRLGRADASEKEHAGKANRLKARCNGSMKRNLQDETESEL